MIENVLVRMYRSLICGMPFSLNRGTESINEKGLALGLYNIKQLKSRFLIKVPYLIKTTSSLKFADELLEGARMKA